MFRLKVYPALHRVARRGDGRRLSGWAGLRQRTRAVRGKLGRPLISAAPSAPQPCWRAPWPLFHLGLRQLAGPRNATSRNGPIAAPPRCFRASSVPGRQNFQSVSSRIIQIKLRQATLFSAVLKDFCAYQAAFFDLCKNYSSERAICHSCWCVSTRRAP